MDIEYSYCKCGCGRKTDLRTKNRLNGDQIKGKPYNYIKGHDRNSRLLGTIRKDTYNYMWIKTSNGWEAEHRVVVEKALGRPLSLSEEVHHIDTIKSNNEPDNLQVCTHQEHMSIHARMRHDALVA